MTGARFPRRLHTTCVYNVDVAKRINIILDESTISTIDRLSRPGERSRFIERAVQHYVATASAEALQERLKKAAIRDHDLDLTIADDWADVDLEQWQNLDSQENRRPALGPGAAKSTSRRSTRG